jgi:hypothetical protein
MRAKAYYRFLLSLAALACSVAALAPASSAADLEFEPGVLVRAHPPQHFPDPDIWIGYMGALFPEKAAAWEKQVADTPELTQAGAHPDFTTHFRFAEPPVGRHPKTVITDTPAGAVGNPRAVPRCAAADFHLTVVGACPMASQVGEVLTESQELWLVSPVSSLVPYPGVSAVLGFKSFITTIILTPDVRSEGDYGLRVTADEIPIPLINYTGSTLTLWGVPHDPVHDPHRVDSVGELGGHVEGTPKIFLSAPTDCSSGPLSTSVKARSWENQDRWIEERIPVSQPTGCEQLEFEPKLSATPSTDVADSPSGLEVDLQVPQHETCEVEPTLECPLATAHLKDATVTLPEGLVVNPSGANGLDGCAPAEAGLTSPLGVMPARFNGKPANCPDASKIGSVEVDTPLLDQPLTGTVNIAEPYENPFKSFLALYIAVDDPSSGITATLAGKVEADSRTGQLTATFPENPQLPFEHFLIHFKQGPHAPLRTPAVCGTFETASKLTSYAAPDSAVAIGDDWQISKGPNGGCATSSAALPNSPSFDAGTVSPIAGAFSPFVMHLRRADGSQNFKTITVSPPEGLVAKLVGVGRCSDSALASASTKAGSEEKTNPSCPAASRVGEVTVGAGAGPSPYYAGGNVYLAGPYKGAPLSLAIVTPAVAGPFDLGTVVVRSAIYVDSKTARITATSDPIPEILAGIPLDVRTIDLALDRNQFTRTGTSCDPSSVTGQAASILGAVTDLSSRFQLAECSSLGFRPKLSLRLRGGTARGKNPALTAVLTPRPGDANIAAVSVALPRAEFLDQAHIDGVCTRVQFAADACPRGSIYGKATVTTPLFDFPLTGNVYLRSSDNELPDLVPDFRGLPELPVKVEAAGRTDSIKGAIRNTFDFVPDVPFTKLVLKLRGGKKGLLDNSRDICARKFRATVDYIAHNGKARRGRPVLHIRSCRAAKERKGKDDKANGSALTRALGGR